MSLKGLRIARIASVGFFIKYQLGKQINDFSKMGADQFVIASDEVFENEYICEYISIPIERNISFFSDLRSIYRMYRKFRELKLDVVHSTTPKAGLVCAIAGFLARVPVRIHTFTGQRWITMTGFRRKLCMLADQLIIMMSTAAYADSRSQIDYLERVGVAPVDKLKMLGYGSLAGVDCVRFSPESVSTSTMEKLKTDYGINENDFVFLFVGRISVDKGVRELFGSFKLIAEKFSHVRLIIVGPIEQQELTEFSEFPEAIAQRIRLVGAKENPEDYMAISDVLVLPSYREGFGTVVIEAGAMGLPSVGTSIYGLSDSIVHGITGLLVSPKNIPELAEAMEWMVRNRFESKMLGVAAQRRARTRFDSEIYSKDLAEQYLTLLNRSKC